MKVLNERKLRFVNALDPAKNRIDKVNVKKFLSEFDHTFTDRSRPSGPSYFIIDNFAKYFKLDKKDLLNAKSEIDILSNRICMDEEAAMHARCDSLLFMEELETNGELVPGLSQIAQAMAEYKPKLNARS